MSRLLVNARFREARFKNCVDCGIYQPVDQDGRCQDCFEIDRELLDRARECLKENPKLTIEEIAEKLAIEESRVAEWLRKHRIKCTAIRKCKCPSCGRVMENRFFCDSCGYNKPSPPVPPPKAIVAPEEEWEHAPRRVKLLREAYWERHSEIQRPYQMRRLWLIPKKGVLLDRP
jgi:hypothetical protein